MTSLGPLLRALQGLNQGVGQGWVLIWKLHWGTCVVVDSIQFLVVVVLQHFLCFGFFFSFVYNCLF